jgi:thiol:disulfide interchange protein
MSFIIGLLGDWVSGLFTEGPMRVVTRAAILLLAASGVLGVTARAQQTAASTSPPAVQAQTPSDKFDPKRDAAADIKAAIAEARKSQRRVILDVGGEWCSWCHILDRYFVDHPDLKETRDRLYVWIKVNWSPDNKNEAVLSQYPAIKGYPHLFVLDQEGKLLQSQDTGLLEEGPSYNYDKMQQFLLRWAPSR